MAITQHFRRTKKTTSAYTTEPTTRSTNFYSLFASNAVLAALSISNVALINSAAGWSLDQKRNARSFQIEWSGSATPLNVEPKRLWVGQVYASDAAGCYGLLLAVFGMFTAWRARNAGRALRSLTALAVLQFIAIWFTTSALIFVFVVTYRTTGRRIREPVASNNIGVNYPEFTWTPETWMKAVLALPWVDGSKRKEVDSKATEMAAWRWMLVPMLVVDCVAFGVTLGAWLKQRRSVTARISSAHSDEK